MSLGDPGTHGIDGIPGVNGMDGVPGPRGKHLAIKVVQYTF